MTKDELRREYQRLLNELDRAPPEKLGFLPVADHRDARIAELEAEVARLGSKVSALDGLLGTALAERDSLCEQLATLTARADELLEQNTRLSGRHSVTLNQYQLLRAVEQCGGIFTGSDLTIEYFDEHECEEDGEKVTRPSGLYLYWTEYPEEGSTPLDDGPLTESFECIVCHVCGNERTIANGATGTDPRGYSDCTNCSEYKGPPAPPSRSHGGEKCATCGDTIGGHPPDVCMCTRSMPPDCRPAGGV